MKISQKIMELLLGIISIYGIFFAKIYITKETDKEISLLGETYKIEDVKNITLKKDLDFIDGVNNGMALLGHWIKSIFILTWDVLTSLNDIIGLLPIHFFWKIVLLIILVFISIFIAALITMITLPVLMFKLLFFKASLSYYLGFCLFWIVVFGISKILEELEKSNKYTKTNTKKISNESESKV